MKEVRRSPYFDLVPEEVVPGTLAAQEGLFLGRFTPAALRRELEGAGILAGLEERGYARVTVETAVQDGEHRLRILATGAGPCLVDLRVAEATCYVTDALMRGQGLESLNILAIHWAALQNPQAAFTPDRPRLPGQRYPGLGFGRRLYGRLMGWANDWGKDALLNFPEYFHNAVFYATLFCFLSPRRQGRFEAMRRDLAGLHVASASAALADGRVIEESTGEVAYWEPAEMVAPVTRSLRQYVDSADYRRIAEETRESLRFRLEPQVA